MKIGRLLLILGLVCAASCAGVFVGRWLIAETPDPSVDLHAALHQQLVLTGEQERTLHRIEAAFAARRQALEAEMRAENSRLADAILAEHGNGPRVTAAVDASHRTMGELQKETLAHIFAMRALLRPDQTEAFDAAVTKALTADAR